MLILVHPLSTGKSVQTKEFYELDEYLSQRYEIFLKQYFNNGKGFIQDLHLAMASKYRKAVMMNNLAKVA